MYDQHIVRAFELAVAQGDDTQALIAANNWLLETGTWLEEIQELYGKRLANASRVQRQIRACRGDAALLIEIINREGMHPMLMEELDGATIEPGGYKLVFEAGDDGDRIRPVALGRIAKDLADGCFGLRAGLIPDSYWTCELRNEVLADHSTMERVIRSFRRNGRELPAWLKPEVL